MKKESESLFTKNFLVNIKHGKLTAQYLFLNFTKKQVMTHIVKHSLFGEALDSIVIIEMRPADNGVIFLGSLKEFQEDNDNAPRPAVRLGRRVIPK